MNFSNSLVMSAFLFSVMGFTTLRAASAADAPKDDGKQINVDLRAGKLAGLMFDEKSRLRLIDVSGKHQGEGEFISAPVDVGQAGSLEVQWLEQWTTPQKWTKYEKNPILTPKMTGAWDGWTNGVAVLRDPDGKSYKMFFAGNGDAKQNGKGGIGYATASIEDPTKWTPYEGNPVLTPRKDNWEGGKINQPRIVKITETHWRMFYTGWGAYPDAPNKNHWAMAMADSQDAGVTWERVNDGKIFMERGEKGAADDGAVFVPHVLIVKGKWYMYYTALKNIPGKQSIHLCLATSDDGMNWTKYEKNPVMTDDFMVGPSRNVLSRCHVDYADGVFKMWYTHGNPAYKIRYAESLDGMNFEQSPVKYVLNNSPVKGAWDSGIVCYPTIDVFNGQWRMWFCGNGFGSVGFAEGVVEASVKLFARTASMSGDDAKWSDWQPVIRGTPLKAEKFVQLKAELKSVNPEYGPALNWVKLAPIAAP